PEPRRLLGRAVCLDSFLRAAHRLRPGAVLAVFALAFFVDPVDRPLLVESGDVALRLHALLAPHCDALALVAFLLPLLLLVLVALDAAPLEVALLVAPGRGGFGGRSGGRGRSRRRRLHLLRLAARGRLLGVMRDALLVDPLVHLRSRGRGA